MPWEVSPPDAWPKPPREMSVSSLRAIESCPRRWALSAASYPDLWQGIGYPARIRQRQLMGSVVHLAIERIVRRLMQANCGSLTEPCGPAAIRDLGGFTSIVRSCIADTVARHANNPRLSESEELRMKLERNMAHLRVAVQSMLCTVPLVSATGPRGYSGRRGRGGRRSPLSPGTYAELELRASELRWRGFVDLLVLSADGACEIRDFKTGEPSDEHEFQIRACSVLWSADGVLNPTGGLARRLTISYPSGEVAVAAPTGDEIEALKTELLRRATAAVELARAQPPEARPHVDTCRRCDVRHLCSDYWQADTQRNLSVASENAHPLGDLQVRVQSRRGPVTWDTVVQRSDRFGKGDPVVLLSHGGRHRVEDGTVLRILDARIIDSSSDDLEDRLDTPIASLTSATEVYSVP